MYSINYPLWQCYISESEQELHIQVVYQKNSITKYTGAKAGGQKKIEFLSTCLKRKICTPRAHYHNPTCQEDTLSWPLMIESYHTSHFHRRSRLKQQRPTCLAQSSHSALVLDAPPELKTLNNLITSVIHALCMASDPFSHAFMKEPTGHQQQLWAS